MSEIADATIASIAVSLAISAGLPVTLVVYYRIKQKIPLTAVAAGAIV